MIRVGKKKFVLLTPTAINQPGRVLSTRIKGYEFIFNLPFSQTQQQFLVELFEFVRKLPDKYNWVPVVKGLIPNLFEGDVVEHSTYHVPHSAFPLSSPFYDFRTFYRTRDLRNMQPRKNPNPIPIEAETVPEFTYYQPYRNVTKPDKKFLIIIAQNPGKAEVCAGVPMVFETGMIVRLLLSRLVSTDAKNIIVVLDNATPALDVGKEHYAQYMSWYSRVRLSNIKGKAAIVVLGASALNFILQEGAMRINAYIGKRLWGGPWNAPIFVGLHPSALVRMTKIKHAEIDASYPGDYMSFGDFRETIKKVFNSILYGKHKAFLFVSIEKAIAGAVRWLVEN